MPKMTVAKKRAILAQLCQYGDMVKKNQTLTRSLIDERLSFVPHKKLYKFRTCTEKNFNTLEENCIWMSPGDSFPDLFDCTINIDFFRNQKEIKAWLNEEFPVLCFELSKKVFEDRGISVPYTHSDFMEYTTTCLDNKGNPIPEKEENFLRAHASPEELAQMNDILDQLKTLRKRFAEHEDTMFTAIVDAINQVRTQMRSKMLIYCMTEHYDNHSLWENYANNYSGFCVEYDFSRYGERDFDDYKNLVFLLPMTYRQTKPYFDIVPFFDGAIRGSIYGDSTWKTNPELNTDLNMQLYYKRKEYSFEREWRFSINNAGNNKQYFPFVKAIYAGKDISSENLNRLHTIAKKLSVPVYRQTTNRYRNGFDYILVEEAEQ